MKWWTLVAILAAGAPPGETPWPVWFEKNTQVTEKAEYVHIFWNARDASAFLQGKEKKSRIAEAALQLVLLKYPGGARDRVRLDIVFVSERDAYGMPNWATLQRVAHLEFSKARLLQWPRTTARGPNDLSAAFEKFEVF